MTTPRPVEGPFSKKRRSEGKGIIKRAAAIRALRDNSRDKEGDGRGNEPQEDPGKTKLRLSKTTKTESQNPQKKTAASGPRKKGGGDQKRRRRRNKGPRGIGRRRGRAAMSNGARGGAASRKILRRERENQAHCQMSADSAGEKAGKTTLRPFCGGGEPAQRPDQNKYRVRPPPNKMWHGPVPAARGCGAMSLGAILEDCA